MLRVIVFLLAAMALPFVAYALYVYFIKRDVPAGGVFVGAPLVWLTAGGLGLTVAAFLVVAALNGADTEGVYRPAELRDGQIVPGRIVPSDEAPGEEAPTEQAPGG